ncbi:MAG: hypothetical protein NTX79_03785 [Candidatus Micrarchaeota archaeon]|nr:hypothetical protein [Candidatus Micrarchaeota archaeon]
MDDKPDYNALMRDDLSPADCTGGKKRAWSPGWTNAFVKDYLGNSPIEALPPLLETIRRERKVEHRGCEITFTRSARKAAGLIGDFAGREKRLPSLDELESFANEAAAKNRMLRCRRFRSALGISLPKLKRQAAAIKNP